LIIAMDCRRFHKSLEDYLQDGLDFSGRFGMERHAQQCISCGKDMAHAQRLNQMARELERVKAPPDFEASVFREIAKRKSRRHFSFLYRTWIYGFEGLSWRKLAIAGCSAAALCLGFLYWPRHQIPNSMPAPSYVAAEQTKAISNENEKPIPAVHHSPMPQPRIVETAGVKSETQPAEAMQEELFREPEIADTEYVEDVMEGPDSRPVTVRLPKKIRMQYGHASEEYFIRNVSH
jgi:hypothetical protein